MRKISQSLIKKVIDRHGYPTGFCPYRLYATTFADDPIPEPTSSAMKKGIYGETLILGKNRDNVEAIAEIDKRKGTKLIDYERIDEQVFNNLPGVLAKYQINIIKGVNVQIPVWKLYDYDGIQALVCGHLDLFPTPIWWPGDDGEETLQMALVDIKFTGDIYNTFGEYSWGDPSKMDHFQADIYQWLVTDFDYELNAKLEPEFEKEVGYDKIFPKAVQNIIASDNLKFIYLVIGFTKTENQIILLERMKYDETVSHITGEVIKSNIRQKDALERTRKAIVQLDEWDDNGYPLHPSYSNCNGCPVSKLNGGHCKGYSYLHKI